VKTHLRTTFAQFQRTRIYSWVQCYY